MGPSLMYADSLVGSADTEEGSDDEEEGDEEHDEEEHDGDDADLSSLQERAYDVYGGRVSDIAVAEIDENVTRIAVSTESANSVFVADLDYSEEDPFADFFFHVIPSMSSVANLGTVKPIAVHGASGKVFGINSGKLVAASEEHEDEEVEIVAETASFSAMKIVDDRMVGLTGNGIMIIDIDDEGNMDGENVVELTLPSSANNGQLVVEQVEERIVVMSVGTSAQLFITDDALADASSSTSFDEISLPSAITTWTSGAEVVTVAPDSRFIIGGSTSTGKVIAYSDDNGSNWTEVDTGVAGIAGPNIIAVGDANDYSVFFGSAKSNDRGSNWSNIASGNTNPNDGPVVQDPLNTNIYFTDDQGLAGSPDLGSSLEGLSDGLLAVQVNDFDMTTAQDVGWMAAKSGIRKVNGFKTEEPSWTQPMYPNNDGSPYYSVAVERSDTTGSTAYAGNTRVYKTASGGEGWEKIFNTDDDPMVSGINTGGGYFSAIEAYDSVVYAGYYTTQNVGSDDGDARGFIIYSDDGGDNFSMVATEVLLNVTDMLLDYNEETEEHRIFVSSEATDGSGYVLMIEDGEVVSTWDFEAEDVSDLDFDFQLGILYAVANDTESNGAPTLYYYDSEDRTESFVAKTTDGLPSSATSQNGSRQSLVSFGRLYYEDDEDDEEEHSDSEEVSTEETEGSEEGDENYESFLVVAVSGTIYVYLDDEEYWEAEYNFPEGTAVNVLFFDDLLVGTGIGLYDQPLGEETRAYDLFGDEETDSIDEEWMFHEDLGPVYLGRYPWLYQSGMGWFYVEDAGEGEDDEGTVFFYMENLDSWGYFDKEDFPYLYLFTGEKFVYFDQDTLSGPTGWVYDFETDQWQDIGPQEPTETPSE